MRRYVCRFRIFELADERSQSVGGIKNQQTCLCFRISQIIIVGLGNIDGDFECHILSGRGPRCLCCCQSIFEPLSHCGRSGRSAARGARPASQSPCAFSLHLEGRWLRDADNAYLRSQRPLHRLRRRVRGQAKPARRVQEGGRPRPSQRAGILEPVLERGIRLRAGAKTQRATTISGGDRGSENRLAYLRRLATRQ